VVAAALAGCFAPKPTPGAPCSPAAPSCPDGETCAQLNGSFQCLAQAPGADAGPAIDDAAEPPPVDGPPPPWQLVQTKDTLGASLNIAPSTGGAVVVVGIETSSGAAVTSVTDEKGSTYVAIARATNEARGFAIELWYAPDVHAGAKRITAGAPAVSAMVAWEVANLRTTGALATFATLDDQAATPTPLGAPIATTEAGEFVVSVAIVGNMVSGIDASGAFTNDHTTLGNGWAHLTDAQAPPGAYQAAWDQPTAGVYCAASAAFFAQ
jgi:hypothetical protein